MATATGEALLVRPSADGLFGAWRLLSAALSEDVRVTREPQVPEPNFHRQATTSLRPESNYTGHTSLLGARKPEAGGRSSGGLAPTGLNGAVC